MNRKMVKSLLLIMDNCQIDEVQLSTINTTGGGAGYRLKYENTPGQTTRAILEPDGTLSPYR